MPGIAERLRQIMQTSDQCDSPIRFGAVFELDLRAGELRKRGQKLKIQGQPIQILAMLVEHPGRVITRDQVRQKLWPSDTYVDFDHGLNNAVNRLREALGDSADAPRFIETLPRKGYRFISQWTRQNPLPRDPPLSLQ